MALFGYLGFLSIPNLVIRLLASARSLGLDAAIAPEVGDASFKTCAESDTIAHLLGVCAMPSHCVVAVFGRWRRRVA